MGQRRAEALHDHTLSWGNSATLSWAYSAASAAAVAAEPLDLTAPMASGRGRPGHLGLARAARIQTAHAMWAACDSPRNNISCQGFRHLFFYPICSPRRPSHDKFYSRSCPDYGQYESRANFDPLHLNAYGEIDGMIADEWSNITIADTPAKFQRNLNFNPENWNPRTKSPSLKSEKTFSQSNAFRATKVTWAVLVCSVASISY